MSAVGSHIPALTGLRGAAALWLMLFHVGFYAGPIDADIRQILDILGAGGFLGVDVFFVLSGFVIALNYSAPGSAPTGVRSYLRFLQRRLARIYPVHFVSLAILVAVIGLLQIASVRVSNLASRELSGLVNSVLLTQAWAFPIRSIWNFPSWSVSTEWLAYLIFPLLSVCTTQIPRALKFAACVALVVALPLLIGDFPYRGTMAYGVPRIAVGFSLGVLLHALRLGAMHRVSGVNVGWLFLVLAIVSGNGLALAFGSQRALLFAPLIAGALVWVLASGNELDGLLASATAQYLGRISYSLYLIHCVWIVLAKSLLGHLGWASSTPHWTFAMALVIVGSLVSAHLLYTWVEEPARRRLTAIGQPKRPTTPPRTGVLHPEGERARPS